MGRARAPFLAGAFLVEYVRRGTRRDGDTPSRRAS